MITKEQFKAYEFVRVSGVTNMWNTRLVSELSGLTGDEVMEVMENYSALKEKYMPE